MIWLNIFLELIRFDSLFKQSLFYSVSIHDSNKNRLQVWFTVHIIPTYFWLGTYYILWFGTLPVTFTKLGQNLHWRVFIKIVCVLDAYEICTDINSYS